MIYTYSEAIKKFGTDYNLKQFLSREKIFKVDSGVYSTEKNPKSIEVFLKTHPNTVFTLESALYYLGISDVIPNRYVIVSHKDSTKYRDKNVIQYFSNDKKLLNLGITKLSYNGIGIPVFNKERILIEVLRYKNKLPYDYYKDVIRYYRDHLYEIDFELVESYLKQFPKKELIQNRLRNEVL